MPIDSKVVKHLHQTFKRAMRDFGEGDHASATFRAITLIEEVGKLVILDQADATGEFDDHRFRNHRKKYALAVYRSLYVNSRVARIYGEQEKQFACWFRDGQLFEIRNAALYVEREPDGTQVVPADAVDPNDARLLVCIAGEVWAEIQGQIVGTGPDEWSSILADVDAFRQKYWLDQPANETDGSQGL